jgi:hypothetical protein
VILTPWDTNPDPSQEVRTEFEKDVRVSSTTQVPVIEGEVVNAIRTLAGRGVGKKAITREVGVAINTVRRYLWQPIAVGEQINQARGG